MDGDRNSKLPIALCAAQSLEASADGEVPEWVHLLPAGEIRTADGRGPYTVEDMPALMAATRKRGKLVLDVNHSTDLKAPKGEEAPARGWIVDLEQRDNGLWGKVEWTPAGRAAVAAREYRGISPAILHTKAKVVKAIARASLVNQPNLEGLVALHLENEDMALKNDLIAALGLDEGADDDAIVAAVKKALGATETATHAALEPLAELLGVEVDGDLAGAITALQAENTDVGNDAVVTALQSQLEETSTALQAMQAERAEEKAVAFVDAAIAEGRVGISANRDLYLEMHRENPARAEKIVGAMPKVPGQIVPRDPAAKASAELTDADHTAIALMGLDPSEYKKARAKELGLEEEAL